MQLLYVTGCCLLSVLGTAGTSRAQAPPSPDTAQARPARWLVKGGLRGTQLRVGRTSASWQVLVPLSLAAERRLGRASLYALLDADVQLSSVGARRRRAAAGADASLPTAALGVGGRYYYGRPAASQGYQPGAPEFGGYLALEAGATATQAAARVRASSRTALVPSCYVLWGTQNRLRHHLLWDLNAGLGLQAPTRTTEYSLPHRSWDVGLQANIRLYWSN